MLTVTVAYIANLVFRVLSSENTFGTIKGLLHRNWEERTPSAYSSELPKWHYADLERHRGEELLNQVIIFVFFVYKKYSRRFITLQLNHWWQMDYSDDAFHTFLDLDTVIYLAVYGTVTDLPVFIQNILNCVPKTNEAFTCLEQHGGKWIMTKFSFWDGVSL